jgi:hypothetical protein
MTDLDVGQVDASGFPVQGGQPHLCAAAPRDATLELFPASGAEASARLIVRGSMLLGLFGVDSGD